MNSDAALLQQLARAHGVQTSYLNMAGTPVHARPEALSAVLAALGIPAGSRKEIQTSLSDCNRLRCKETIEPVTVAWDGHPTAVRLHVPSPGPDRVRAVVQLEDGGRIPLRSLALKRVAEVIEGRQRSWVLELTLPRLPIGYHELQLTIDRRELRSLVLSAPRRGYSRAGRRDWGLFLPMYAAQSSDNWGTGNFADWRRLCDWTRSLGGTVIGTLPLLGAFLDFPKCEPSPYSPASRLFWNEFYLDIPAIPEFREPTAASARVRSAKFQAQIRRWRRRELIDYSEEWRLRRDVLEHLADEFFAHDSPRRRDFEQFLRQRPEALDYARFRAMCDESRKPWHRWPRRLQSGDLRDGDCDPRLRNFHLYIQWTAQRQVVELIGHCRRRQVEFYLDLPLGVNPDGYDVWRDRDSFATTVSAGAPPDAFFTLGQNWGFAPLHPRQIRRNGYRHVLDFLRFQMRHTGLLRIDHVMQLHRLFWIPQGFGAADGVYIRYPAEELHALLSLESHRHRTTLIGENLGTVPPEVNDAMKRHGMRGMFVVQYQQQPDATNALPSPPRQSVASLNTHDLPMFAAHWHGLEILEHARLGLVSEKEVRSKRTERRRLNEALAAFLRSQRLLKNSRTDLKSILPALLTWLGRSPAEFVLVNLEDLFFETRPQNMPGTGVEQPNWRRKMKRTLETIVADPEIRDVLRRLHRARRAALRRKQTSAA